MPGLSTFTVFCLAADSVQAAQRPKGLALTAMEETRWQVRCKRVDGLHRMHNAVDVDIDLVLLAAQPPD